MVEKGQTLYESLGCITCHQSDGKGRAPKLAGLYGSKVELKGGATVVADAAYIRESIVNPLGRVVNGYDPIMPTFQGLVTEDQIQQIIEYIRSMRPDAAAPVGATTNPAPPKK
jgi:cytochrome c oxidase subunit 2